MIRKAKLFTVCLANVFGKCGRILAERGLLCLPAERAIPAGSARFLGGNSIGEIPRDRLGQTRRALSARLMPLAHFKRSILRARRRYFSSTLKRGRCDTLLLRIPGFASGDQIGRLNLRSSAVRTKNV